jgi:hypothetical protein
LSPSLHASSIIREMRAGSARLQVFWGSSLTAEPLAGRHCASGAAACMLGRPGPGMPGPYRVVAETRSSVVVTRRTDCLRADLGVRGGLTYREFYVLQFLAGRDKVDGPKGTGGLGLG